METALKKGSVDAILAVEPFVTLSIAHGTARYLEKSVHKNYGDRFMIASRFHKEDLQQMIDTTARYNFIKKSFKADDILSNYIR